jgi:hypothetical protein
MFQFNPNDDKMNALMKCYFNYSIMFFFVLNF